jgi:hypothetical protein
VGKCKKLFPKFKKLFLKYGNTQKAISKIREKVFLGWKSPRCLPCAK